MTTITFGAQARNTSVQTGPSAGSLLARGLAFKSLKQYQVFSVQARVITFSAMAIQ